MAQKISPSDLVDMCTYVKDAPLAIDLVYAQAGHPENIFGCALYKADAPFLLHDSLARIVLGAARHLHKTQNWTCVLMDGLRPVEAQEAMQRTAIVQRNPHWCQGPNRLLSPPGHGGHPRGMAVDIVCIDGQGNRIDMGTAFDHLSKDPAYNPAARSFKNLPAAVLQNRHLLETAMTTAAQSLGLPLLPLPAEWWDFRLPPDFYNAFAPLSDHDLPAHWRMTCNKDE